MNEFFHRSKVAAIPRLPLPLLQLAQCCAEEVWSGREYWATESRTKPKGKGKVVVKSFRTNKIPSDEHFLIRLSGHHFHPHRFQGAQLLSKAQPPIDKPLLRSFNLVASTGIDRRLPKADYAAACQWLQVGRRVRLQNWMARRRSFPSVSIGTTLINDLSKEFSAQILPEIKFGLFSNRIAFFAYPEIDIYNFSNDIAKSLRLFGSPEQCMNEYSKILDRGFSDNWDQLCLFQMPSSNQGEHLFNKTIAKGNWWQRRVYDIALKIRASATPILFSVQVMEKFTRAPVRYL